MFLSTYSKLLAPLLLALTTHSARASADLYETRFQYGRGNEEIKTFDISFRTDISQRLHKLGLSETVFEKRVRAYLDTSVFAWKSSTNNLAGAAVSPKLAYEFYSHGKLTTYAEIGLGVALISDTTIGQREMSSAFHFKSNLTLGLRYDDYNFFLQAEHYSNAGLANPNWGLDVISLGIGLRF